MTEPYVPEIASHHLLTEILLSVSFLLALKTTEGISVNERELWERGCLVKANGRHLFLPSTCQHRIRARVSRQRGIIHRTPQSATCASLHELCRQSRRSLSAPTIFAAVHKAPKETSWLCYWTGWFNFSAN